MKSFSCKVLFVGMDDLHMSFDKDDLTKIKVSDLNGIANSAAKLADVVIFNTNGGGQIIIKNSVFNEGVIVQSKVK